MAATTDAEFPCAITLDIPFPSSRLATTALKAIEVDPERSPLVRRQMSIVKGSDSAEEAQVLKVEYRAATNRMLRVAVNSFMDGLKLAVEIMEQLDTDVLEQSRSEPPQS
ncbi:Fc.00g065420.m01.CDS01 [Cosmosporella sp. VM-42]